MSPNDLIMILREGWIQAGRPSNRLKLPYRFNQIYNIVCEFTDSCLGSKQQLKISGNQYNLMKKNSEVRGI